ncbi:MAG: MlaD family protein [Bacteroidota bacterium]
MKKNSNDIWKLGMFVVIGLALLTVSIYFIGENKNLFGSTFNLRTNFKNVGGLDIGNNVRFSGINVGTVQEIEFVSDSSVVIKMVIKEEVKKYIKTDATASIGSDGLMGDKVLTISPGTESKKIVKDNDVIKSTAAIEIEDLMKGLKRSIDNAAIITDELAVFTTKMNNGNSVLSKLVNDDKLGASVGTSLKNVEQATAELKEIEAAAKNNFLLKGYFKKKKKAEEKKAEDKKDAAEKKAKEAEKKAAEKK